MRSRKMPNNEGLNSFEQFKPLQKKIIRISSAISIITFLVALVVELLSGFFPNFELPDNLSFLICLVGFIFLGIALCFITYALVRLNIKKNKENKETYRIQRFIVAKDKNYIFNQTTNIYYTIIGIILFLLMVFSFIFIVFFPEYITPTRKMG